MAFETGDADCHRSHGQRLSHSRHCPLFSRLPPSIRVTGIAGRHINKDDFLRRRGQILIRLLTSKQLPIVFVRGYIECERAIPTRSLLSGGLRGRVCWSSLRVRSLWARSSLGGDTRNQTEGNSQDESGSRVNLHCTSLADDTLQGTSPQDRCMRLAASRRACFGLTDRRMAARARKSSDMYY